MMTKDAENTYRTYIQSEIGTIAIAGTAEGVRGLSFYEGTPPRHGKTPACLKNAVQQLEEYFNGTRSAFSLPLILEGTDFQKAVWRQLMEIPYGEIVAYRDIARQIGYDRAARAVASTNSRNKIAIIVPCHRVNSCIGALTGYSGGLWRKQWLLDHEKKFAKK